MLACISKPNLNGPSEKRCRIAFEGDSTTTGLTSQGSPGTSYPSQLMTSFTSASWQNFAAGGNTVDQMLTQTGPIIAFNPEIIVFWGGVNDLLRSDTPANIYDEMTQWVNLIRAGLPTTRIIFMTLPPMTTTANGPTQSALTTKLNALNVRIVGNLAGADVVLDLSNDLILAPGGGGRTQDGIHYNGSPGNSTIGTYPYPEIEKACLAFAAAEKEDNK